MINAFLMSQRRRLSLRAFATLAQDRREQRRQAKNSQEQTLTIKAEPQDDLTKPNLPTPIQDEELLTYS